MITGHIDMASFASLRAQQKRIKAESLETARRPVHPAINYQTDQIRYEQRNNDESDKSTSESYDHCFGRSFIRLEFTALCSLRIRALIEGAQVGSGPAAFGGRNVPSQSVAAFLIWH